MSAEQVNRLHTVGEDFADHLDTLAGRGLVPSGLGQELRDRWRAAWDSGGCPAPRPAGCAEPDEHVYSLTPQGIGKACLLCNEPRPSTVEKTP